MSVLQGTGYAATATSTASPAATSGTLRVTAPDGSISTPTVSNYPAPNFAATVPADQVGTYLLVWTLTGSAPTQVVQDQFTVIAPAVTLSNLEQVKIDLNKSNDGSKDAKIRQWLREATTVVENICGPIIPRTETYTTSGGGIAVSIPRRWVVSIVSVTENWGGTNYPLTEQPLGSSTTPYGYTWDRTTNTLVRRGSNGDTSNFPDGVSNVTVVYRAGMATIPDAIQRAASQLVMHWYNKDDQPVGSNFSRSGDDYPTSTVGSFEVPRAIMEVLNAYEDWSGFA